MAVHRGEHVRRGATHAHGDPRAAFRQGAAVVGDTPGTEYSDLDHYGYIEQEYYLQGVAPAINAAGQTLLEAPYTTRILVRKPADPARFNGTVVIEPFSCSASAAQVGF